MIIIGAKGFAKQLVEIFFERGQSRGLYFFDNVSNDVPDQVFGLPVLRNIEAVKNVFADVSPEFCLGIGTPQHRRNLRKIFEDAGGLLTSVISDGALLASHVKYIGTGVTILSGVIVENDAVIEDGVLLNTQCSVHHDCVIGAYSEISPGARILGQCSIGNNCVVGSNAVILPKLSVSNDVMIGAGAVVTKNISEPCTVVGIPAKPFKHPK